jgi:hypothetical protein
MYLGILIMSGRGGVYADEEHKDKKETKVMCLEPSGSHPKQGKALGVNWEPTLQIAIDCSGSRTPNP